MLLSKASNPRSNFLSGHFVKELLFSGGEQEYERNSMMDTSLQVLDVNNPIGVEESRTLRQRDGKYTARDVLGRNCPYEKGKHRKSNGGGEIHLEKL